MKTISQMTSRSRIALAVLGLLAGSAFGQSEDRPSKLTFDDLFPTDRVLDVRITLEKESWQLIRYQTRTFATALSRRRQRGDFEKPYTYVDARVTIDGVELPGVGIRKKGFIGSLSTNRPSFKIKLNFKDKQRSIDGLNNLTFNNNQQDPSLVNQFLCYALFNAAGSPAPRCAFARLTVNGKYLGIYSHVETMRAPLLERGFGSADGTLYEGTVADFFQDWARGFERKLGDDDRGRTAIRRLIEVLKAPVDHERVIAELVDLEAFYKYWALEGLLGFWDGYSGNKNNYFVYLHPTTGRFHFLPWGADSMFGPGNPFENDPDAPISVQTAGLVANRLYRLDSARRRYADTIKGLLDKHWDEKVMLTEVGNIEEMLEPHLGPTQRRAFDALDDLRDFIEGRRAAILAEIEDGMPDWNKKPKRPFVMPSRDDDEDRTDGRGGSGLLPRDFERGCGHSLVGVGGRGERAPPAGPVHLARPRCGVGVRER